MTHWLAPLLGILALPALAGGGDTFEPGQRWVCVTEQGAEAYMSILNVEGTAVSFSYGILDADTKQLNRLCNKRDALNFDEMLEFCSILGEEFSDGHVRLVADCAAEEAQ